jgi:Domain of unknown function (DUF4349)
VSMDATQVTKTIFKRLILVVCALVGIVLVSVISCRIAIQHIFGGISSSSATGLSAVAWDPLQSGSSFFSGRGSASISRNAELHTRTTSFEESTSKLQQIVVKHHGEFEDLRTDRLTGRGRSLVTTFSVPATELDSVLQELEDLGRTQRVSETSEDASVKSAQANRRVLDARSNLARLQALRQEHRAGIQDALTLQKEIVKATDEVAQEDSEQQKLLATSARAAIHFVLLEQYQARFDSDFPGAMLRLQNSLFEGLSSTLSSMAIVFATLLEYGLPIAFWALLLYFPSRMTWRKIQHLRNKSQTAASA